MGAAGLTCSTTEMASKSGTGIEIDLDLVPQREEGMTPYEMMLSESQERMLAILKEGKEIGVIDLYKLKPTNQNFVKDILEKYKQIISLEEHLLAGGLGSIISELIVDNNLPTKLQRIGLNDEYYYLYGRENIHKKVGLDFKSISQTIENLV